MTFDSGERLTPRQRWSNAIAIIVALAVIAIGMLLRADTLGDSRLYSDITAGISVQYPANWLFDQSDQILFLVRNTAEAGFPTTIQIVAIPASTDTTIRAIFDALTLNRSQTLASYNVLSSGEAFTLPDESNAAIMNYSYAAVENDPFLKNVPIVVRGQDVVTIKRGQALIITFLCNALTYDVNYPVFQRFLNTLDF